MIKYDIFSYQISPITNAQISIFGQETNIETLTARKNEFFFEIFTNIVFYNGRKKLTFRVLYKDSSFMLLQLANRKTVRIERNFQNEYLETEPSCIIAIDNNPTHQLVAIESDRTSFGDSFSVLNILEKSIDRELSKYYLRFYPQPKYEEAELWELLRRYEGRLEKLRFEFSKPNLARVNDSISEELKEAAKMINSASTKIEFDAPKEQTLENLNENNQPLADLVKASSEGAGPAKLKLTGIRRWESTAETVKSFEIDQLEIDADQNSINTFVSQLKEILRGE